MELVNREIVMEYSAVAIRGEGRRLHAGHHPARSHGHGDRIWRRGRQMHVGRLDRLHTAIRYRFCGNAPL